MVIFYFMDDLRLKKEGLNKSFANVFVFGFLRGLSINFNK